MLCEQLKIVRKANKFTQQQTADALGIERSTYASYETGRNRPDISVLESFAKIFGVSVDFVVNVDTRAELSFFDVKSKYTPHENEQLLSTLTKEEQNILALYRQCDDSGKKAVKEQLRKSRDKSKKK